MVPTVAAASFCRLECDHTELFQPEYKRSNRTKGLKILRCFPHCCPSHIDRSYCGSSLNVLVQLQEGTTSNEDDDNDDIVVFARFESVCDVGLEIGEVVPVSRIEGSTQSEDNPDGEWIPGVRERSATLSSLPTVALNNISSQALIFQLNAKVYSRWYYDWESGANKAQRLMKHVIKAYIFTRSTEEVPVADDGASSFTSSPVYKVISVVVSPEFTVISYRRAPSEQTASGAKATTPPSQPPNYVQRLPCPTGGDEYDRQIQLRPSGPKVNRHGAWTSALSHVNSKQPLYHHPQPLARIVSDERAAKRRRRSTSPPPLISRTMMRSSVQPSQVFDDQVIWEHANSSIVTISKNLSLLYRFVQWTPVKAYASFVDELVHLMHQQLLEPLAVTTHQVTKINCFSRVLIDHAQVRNEPVNAPPYELETLFRVVVQATIWLFSKQTLAWMGSFFQHHAPNVLEKQALRSSFLLFVTEIEEQLNRHVLAHTPLRTVAHLADEIIAAVYSYEIFYTKRPLVRNILGAYGFTGWNPFVAQMRDTYISTVGASRSSKRNLPPRPQHSGEAMHASSPSPFPSIGPRNMFERGWNGEWLLDMDEASWKPPTSDTFGSGSDTLSLFTIFELISQMVRLEVELSVQDRVLSLRSGLGMATAAGLNNMKLVLDGKERVCRMYPNGMSSSVGGGAFGDYVAALHFEGPERLVVYLETFRWAVAVDGPSYDCRLRIECWRNQRLYVNGDVLQTAAPSSFPPEERPYLSEMNLRAKRKAVHKAYAQTAARPAAPSSSQSSASTGAARSPAWKLKGKFRLVYNKVK